MYESFAVRNFRGFRELSMEGFGRITLLTGANNVGKTALLEAIFAHSAGSNPAWLPAVNAIRGLAFTNVQLGTAETPWAELFYRFDTSKTIEFEGKLKSFGERRLQVSRVTDPEKLRRLQDRQLQDQPIQGFAPKSEPPTSLSIEPSQVLQFDYSGNSLKKETSYFILGARSVRVDPPVSPSPPLTVLYQSEARPVATGDNAQRFSQLQASGQDALLIDALREIEPRLKALRILVIGNEPSIYGDIGLGHLLPIAMMGEGTGHFLQMVLGVATTPRGVVMLDEIENGLHHSVHEKVWRSLNETAKRFDTQVIVTTHSFECIEAFYAASQISGGFDPILFRLDRRGEDIRAVRYDQESLEGALEHRLEVR